MSNLLPTGYEALADGPALSVDAACDQFESAWRGGRRPAIDSYLEKTGNDDQLVLLHELILLEIGYRRRAGEIPTSIEYQSRFPHLDATWLAKAVLPATVAGEPFAGATDASALTSIPGFEILGERGRGGMGVVHQARDLRLGRLVALKFLRPEATRDPRRLERFRREARAASTLNHPAVCTLYELGDYAGQPYLVLEWIEGQTLRSLIGSRLDLERIVPIVRQAAEALRVAHAAGIVHRDIKPENLMIRPDGYLKVLDFGLARLLPGGSDIKSVEAAVETASGLLMGTACYMSPEQSRSQPVDSASDIFSLGIVIYELSTGQHPFQASAPYDTLTSIINYDPIPPRRLNPEIPEPLNELVVRMLAKEPRDRPTAAEVEAFLAADVGGRSACQSRPAAPVRRWTVGRDRERAALLAAFDATSTGLGSVVCVSGEPGIGKTTLVESFLDELAASGKTWGLARGRCSERLAGTEAYLPYLEALDSLLDGDGGASVAQAMKLLAPTWYVQLAPPPTDDPSLARLHAEAKEASQERRKRELGVFLHEISRQRPLIVFLDDVHWADPSSTDLLAYLGSKCTGWRLLLILTCRPSDLLQSQHPFGPIKLEMQARGVCREITLPFLNRDDLAQYLALAFAGHVFPEEFANVLQARTEGNPLFVVDLLRYLRDCGVIVPAHGVWKLARTVPDLQGELPESVRSMIQRKVNQLSADDRQLLMAASVQGPEFDSAVVAQVLGRDATDVEERLDVLERVHFMVRLIREQSFPDRTLTLRYGFVHVLYQNALYAALQPTRKAAWSAAAARALMGHYGEKSAALAAELAMLFEAAREYEIAADYYRTAAENAARIFAHHEAVALARRGLAQLETLPDTHDRARSELPLQVTLGVQLQVVHGYAAPEAERTYDRARMLCESTEEAPSLFFVLWGLWMLYEVRSDLKKARELGDRLLMLAQVSHDRAHLIQAHMALSVTSFSLGNLAATRDHTEQAVVLYDPRQHSNHCHLYGQDPKVTSLAFGAVALWLLGYPDQAVRRSREAVALGGELGHPTTRALSLYFATMLKQYCRESLAVQSSAEATTAIGAEHRLSLWLANGLVMGGWALAEQGACARGIAMLRQGLTNWADTGAETHRTYFLGLLAEALGRGGQIMDGLDVLTQALALTQSTGTVFYGAELHRLQGEFLLRQASPEGAYREAEICFRQALTLARQQQAKSLELRAAMSLTRLYQKQNRQAEARIMLAECYDWFTEGFDTFDLREANALLEIV